MLVCKCFHRHGKDVRGERRGIAKPQSDAVSLRTHPFNGKFCVPEKFSRFLKKCLTRRCETNGVSLAVEQPLTDGFFQRLYLSAQRGLGQKTFLCRATDVPLLRHRHEVTQLSKFHVGQHNEKYG